MNWASWFKKCLYCHYLTQKVMSE